MRITNAKDEREFDIIELWNAVINKIWIVLVTGISSAIILFIISNYVMEWKYESTTQIYVLSKQDSISEVTYSDLQISSYLIKDYMALSTNRLVTEQVIAELKLDMKHEELVKLIQVENPDETRILNIKVEYKDPVVAKQIADAVREATTGLITKLSDHEQANQIVEANIPEKPSKPNVKRNTILGGALGVMISAFISILLYLSDDTIKTSDDIEKYLDIRVLSMIPRQKDKTFWEKLKITRKITGNNVRGKKETNYKRSK